MRRGATALTILPSVAPPVLLGNQRPRILHVPTFRSSTGQEAVELAAMAGLEVDPWQEFVIHNALGEAENGKWAAFEVGVEVARQNGKGGILEVRELAGLFILGERLLIHTAHEFKTSEEALERMVDLISGSPDLSRRVRTVKRSHGQEGIYLKSGQRLRYATRTKGGGRGFSADFVALDEAMKIPEAMHGALMPTLSARENPQLWYTGSAVDQESMDDGVVFARVRERAIKGEDPALAYFGWSPNVERPDDLDDEQAADPETWALANPGLGIRISAEHIAREHRSMDPRTFAVERLGVGDWPSADGKGARLISGEQWNGLADVQSTADGRVCFAFDVAPDRASAAIGVAGRRSDGKSHIEVIDHRRGTAWIADRLVELRDNHANVGVVCDGVGPAGSMLPALAAVGIRPELTTAKDHAQACGRFFDAVNDDTLRHLGTRELRSAIAGAATRPLGDAWAWSRKSSAVDISPLVATTLALWGMDALLGQSLGPMFEVIV
jgi:hypothetical protein